LATQLLRIPPEIQEGLHEEGMMIALKVWRLHKEGCDRYVIARKLKLAQSLIDNILQEFARRLAIETGHLIQYYRHLDNERIEGLIQYWWPIATGCNPDEILADQISEDDFEHALKAGYIILNAIEKRMEILFLG
jgi:hypothetical protein